MFKNKIVPVGYIFYITYLVGKKRILQLNNDYTKGCNSIYRMINE